MEKICLEREKARNYAFAIWGLAKEFAGVKGGPMTLVLRDGKFIREVFIDPEAIAIGNLRVDVRPQPGKAGPRRQTIYDLDRPPTGSNDIAELAVLADLLLRPEQNFPEEK